jgi:hypothetical protein
MHQQNSQTLPFLAAFLPFLADFFAFFFAICITKNFIEVVIIKSYDISL